MFRSRVPNKSIWNFDLKLWKNIFGFSTIDEDDFQKIAFFDPPNQVPPLNLRL